MTQSEISNKPNTSNNSSFYDAMKSYIQDAMPNTKEEKALARSVALSSLLSGATTGLLARSNKAALLAAAIGGLGSYGLNKIGCDKKASYTYIKRAFSLVEDREQYKVPNRNLIKRDADYDPKKLFSNPSKGLRNITTDSTSKFLYDDLKTVSDNAADFNNITNQSNNNLTKTLGYGTGGLAGGAGLGYLLKSLTGSDSNVLPAILAVIGGLAGAGIANKDEILNYLNK